MKYNAERFVTKPYLHTEKNVVYRVNEEFLQLTGYKENDLVGKLLMDISILLKIENQVSLLDIEDTTYLYIFNSDHLPLEVKVSFDISDNEHNKIYYFEENIDSALEFIIDNFGDTNTTKNGSIAIFSYPNCILLKHDKNYIHTLSLMNISSDNIIGKHPLLSDNILNLFKQNISFHESGLESTDPNGVATYWDIDVKRISGNRNNNYLIASFYHVTEKVSERKFSKVQRRGMQQVLDNMTDTINIIDKDGKYTYINKVGREKLSPYIPYTKAVDSKMVYHSSGMYDVNGKGLLFEDTPDQRVLRGETFTNYIIIGADEGTTAYHECDGMPIYDERGNIEGGILIYRDIKDSYRAEEYRVLQENIKHISIYYT